MKTAILILRNPDCKMKLKYPSVKSKGFVTEYFSNPYILLSAIKKYTEVSNIPKGEKTLMDLIRKER